MMIVAIGNRGIKVVLVQFSIFNFRFRLDGIFDGCLPLASVAAAFTQHLVESKVGIFHTRGIVFYWDLIVHFLH
jgi:hypothetical protein